MDLFLTPESVKRLQFLDTKNEIYFQCLFWIQKLILWISFLVQKLTLWARGTLYPFRNDDFQEFNTGHSFPNVDRFVKANLRILWGSYNY